MSRRTERQLTVERVWQAINELAARYGWSRVDSVKLRRLFDDLAAAEVPIATTVTGAWSSGKEKSNG